MGRHRRSVRVFRALTNVNVDSLYISSLYLISHFILIIIMFSILFKGLRVRMGVHLGMPKLMRDPMTRRVEYIGPVINVAARITAITHGGQVVMSHAVQAKCKGTNLLEAKKVVSLGQFEMPDSPEGTLIPLALFFGHTHTHTHTHTSDHRGKEASCTNLRWTAWRVASLEESRRTVSMSRPATGAATPIAAARGRNQGLEVSRT